jgi:serine/threonine-protein kinase
MGRVDEVYDGLLGRCVAQKALLGHADDDRATGLIAEAQTCAQLEHPSIVPVYDIGTDATGNPYYTMRVVRGRTFRDLIADNLDPAASRTPLAQMLGILRQVCLAVDYAHSRGVVHRDLKPDNVVLGEFGEVYVVDWGIAHVQEGSPIYRASSSIAIAGTPGYMAPEQLLGTAIDGRADVFALGVMLYEILSGARPFADSGLQSVVERRTKSVDVPPSRRNPVRAAPTVFDELVLACLSPDPKSRPARARAIADAIDAFLDGERARAEREKEALAYAKEGEAARSSFEDLDARGRALAEQGEKALAELPAWAEAEKKQSAWLVLAESRRLLADAARALARAEAAFARALGRVANHAEARRGLAALYFRQFEAAETDGDEEQMARYLDLARTYDDGELALEIANRGELVIQAESGIELRIARYEPRGPLLCLVDDRMLDSPAEAVSLLAGSYSMLAERNGISVRYPLVIHRAKRHRLALRFPTPGAVPAGMVLIPGGPWMASVPGSSRLQPRSLRDFAIGRLPVTFGEYALFLDTLDEAQCQQRLPRADGAAVLIRDGDCWRLCPDFIAGAARKYVPEDRELELPVMGVRWYDAVAYARWRSESSGLALRLPTDLEWDKAFRGADARPVPMGTGFDPSFAKTRGSRPEASQPEPVGAFPLDESPYGVRDLAGGVGDWTRTAADGSDLDDAPEGETDDVQAIWRGGSWASSAVTPNVRYTQALWSRGSWIGFRLALSLDQHGSSHLVVEPMKKKRA